MATRAGFGTVDKLPSGRWRARYRDPDGKRRTKTFPRRTDARTWLATVEADLVRRQWRAPERSRVTVGEYADRYLGRADLRASTRALYEGTWRLHLADSWGSVPVVDVGPQRVREWHESAATRTGATALAQAYRLLRAILNVAVADEIIGANPCRLRNAATARPARPSRALTPQEVGEVAALVPDRYRALVLVLAYGALRFGEATALRRRDVSDDGSLITIERSVRLIGGAWVEGPPKTDAGRRRVSLPPSVAIVLLRHMSDHVPMSGDALIFGTATGNYLASNNWSRTFRNACAQAGLPPTRSHELRHTGSTLAAAAGASTRELMARLGHSSPSAALIYQHAAADRDAEIARALDAVISPGAA